MEIIFLLNDSRHSNAVTKPYNAYEARGAKPKVHDVYAVGGCKIRVPDQFVLWYKWTILGGVLTIFSLSKCTF